ncbi:ATP-dependent DNA ligase [Cryobacterium zhongshanensis]|uniref:WGR domain-containing protein n=1 Tax=Cryobacterium zhongshanensis TaxID=2928153 RepID=A0AA41UIM9_9MICO|nr:WGR domain-containing protein [Cryobacterium zhongshanensis]MCI4659709.1 WGR domain-containing protein [Cryobacterium zhongshanensis]
MNITIQEAQYVDERTGNDKFYRTFVFDSVWVTQYGRNGTIGTFTKIVVATSPAAAQSAADAKYASKVKKGYTPERSGVVVSASDIDATNLTSLDELAEALPMGTSTAIVSAPVNVVDLGVQRAADLTKDVHASLLSLLGAWVATAEDKSPTLPMRPMLASVQTAETVASAMLDTAWVAQFKYDGDRVVIEVTDGDIRVLNRQGQEKVKNIGTAHLRPFSALNTGRWVFDGEVVGRTLVLYDLAVATDGDSTWVNERTPFSIRYTVLSDIVGILGIPEVASASVDAPVVLAPVASTNVAKDQFLATAVAEQREGIILRHLDGLYELGRRSTTLIKHKLIKDADVIITSLHGTKSSATLAVHALDGSLVEVGASSTIGKGDVRVGDVWLVTFLYVVDPRHPHLFQPRLVRRRDDKSAAACTIDQFVDAGTSRKV